MLGSPGVASPRADICGTAFRVVDNQRFRRWGSDGSGGKELNVANATKIEVD